MAAFVNSLGCIVAFGILLGVVLTWSPRTAIEVEPRSRPVERHTFQGTARVGWHTGGFGAARLSATTSHIRIRVVGTPDLVVRRAEVDNLAWTAGSMRRTCFMLSCTDGETMYFSPVAWMATVRTLRSMGWDIPDHPIRMETV